MTLNKLPLGFAIAAAFAVGGCSLAPDYTRPTAPVAAEWNAPADGARRVEETPWQAFFPDPGLQALIAAALDNNRDMRIAVARVEEARGLFGVQRAERFPGVDIVGSRNASRTPGSVSVTGQDFYTRRYDAGIGITNFELDFWGRVANLSEAARANYLSSEYARRSFRLSLIADVARAYFTLLEMDDRAQLATATVASRQESRDLISKRREVGIAGDLDFLQADGALELAKADLANLERQRAVAANALVLLVGQPSFDQNLPPARHLNEQGVVADLKVDLPSEVLLRRPDILAAEESLKAANANIGAARAAFLPQVMLSASFGSAAPLMSKLFDSGTKAWSFQPTLRSPLFDLGVGANLDVAEARKVIAVAQYEKTIQQAFREVADLLVARDQLVKQLTALDAAEKTQSERLRLADARYKAGIAGYLDVLDAQREAYNAQQSAIQARSALLTAAADLYKALGGGEAEPTNKPAVVGAK